MNKCTRYHPGKGLRAILAATAFAAPASASVTLVNQGVGSLASWEIVNGAAPVYTSVATPATATVSQNNNGVTSVGATNYSLIETFTPSSSYTLAAIGVSASGATNATDVTMHLYDLTGRLTSNNGTPTQGSGATYSRANPALLTDLLGGGAGATFSSPGQGQAELTFLLDGADQVALIAGRTYALEFWNPYAAPGFNWWRAGAVATDGQMMFSADASSVGTGPISSNPGNYPFLDSRVSISSAGFAGAAPRTASLALYAVPEPASLGLLAVSAGAMLLRRRV